MSKVNNGDNRIGINPNKQVVFKILNQIGIDPTTIHDKQYKNRWWGFFKLGEKTKVTEKNSRRERKNIPDEEFMIPSFFKLLKRRNLSTALFV